MSSGTWGSVVRGVALGDAWGNPNEFLGIDELTRVHPQGPDLPKELIVTDDTQMTLYLAEALRRTAGQDQDAVKTAIQEEFLNYLADPDFYGRAPGRTVTGSLTRLKSGLPWQEATDRRSDGCGTVMRVTPTAFCDDWVGVAAFSAAVTHGSANGIAAAILTTALVREAITQGSILAGALTWQALTFAWEAKDHGLLDTGTWLDGLDVDLAEGFAAVGNILVKTRDVLMQGYGDTPWAIDPCEFGGQGWRAHECLATALLAIDALADEPWMGLRRAVTTGGDSDSIGAVAGGLLGALWGPFWPDGALDWLEPRYQNLIVDSDVVS